MNDRGLLEMAARAAGLSPVWGEWRTSRVSKLGTIAHTKHSGFRMDGKAWNPLASDGDALRLAVGLQLQIRPNDYDVMVVAHLPAHITVAEVCDHKDPYAATRRAIVRAAAEIGRTMTTESVR